VVRAGLAVYTSGVACEVAPVLPGLGSRTRLTNAMVKAFRKLLKILYLLEYRSLDFFVFLQALAVLPPTVIL
jgi:hypothetical protein